MKLTELKFRVANRSFPKVRTGEVSPKAMEVQSISVILDSGDLSLLDKFTVFMTKFNLKESDFIVMTCTGSGEKQLNHLNFTEADISWTGKIKNKELQEVMGRSPDILIAFSEASSDALEFLVRNTEAGLKVGRAENSAGLYDLEIFSRYAEVDVFIKEVEKYLEILKYRSK